MAGFGAVVSVAKRSMREKVFERSLFEIDVGVRRRNNC